MPDELNPTASLYDDYGKEPKKTEVEAQSVIVKQEKPVPAPVAPLMKRPEAAYQNYKKTPAERAAFDKEVIECKKPWTEKLAFDREVLKIQSKPEFQPLKNYGGAEAVGMKLETKPKNDKFAFKPEAGKSNELPNFRAGQAPNNRAVSFGREIRPERIPAVFVGEAGSKIDKHTSLHKQQHTPAAPTSIDRSHGKFGRTNTQAGHNGSRQPVAFDQNRGKQPGPVAEFRKEDGAGLSAAVFKEEGAGDNTSDVFKLEKNPVSSKPESKETKPEIPIEEIRKAEAPIPPKPESKENKSMVPRPEGSSKQATSASEFKEGRLNKSLRIEGSVRLSGPHGAMGDIDFSGASIREVGNA